MGTMFSGTEIIDIAVGIENNGVAFYEGLKASARDARVKEFAERLAEEERFHEKEFTRMRDALGDFGPSEAYSGEYMSYVRP